MGLSWISPLYLSGLLLLAIPLLIHLAQKQHQDSASFPSLMFLRRIPRRQKRRLRIRNWLLLLLRCLLLLLLVFAFARPLFNDGAALLDPERSDSVILLDRSWSMHQADRWQQARELALRLLAEKPAADRIGLVLFDEEAEILSELTADSGNLRTLLQRPSPGFRATRLSTAIEQAARLLAGSNAGDRRIFVVSDFQAAAAADIPRIAADIEVTALPVDSAPIANVALTSIAIAPSSNAAADEFALALEITNFSDRLLQPELILTLDGREHERRKLQLPPGAVSSETFDGLGVSDDLLRGVVSLGDDDLLLDNRAYFVYSPAQRLPLLIVEGPAARANQGVYVENALRLSRQPMFGIERANLASLEPADLQDRAAILLNDVAIPSGEPGRALAEFVAAGGALLIALGETAPGAWPGNDDFLPGSLGGKVDATRGTAFTIAGFEAGHPLSTTRGAQSALDLSRARVFSYRELEPGPRDRVVARYSDGGAALLERRVGRGRVLVLTTTLDPHWNDLALQPAFPPLLQQTLRYLTAYESYAHESRIGSITDVLRYARSLAGPDAMLAAADDVPLTVETPSTRALQLDRQSPLLRLEEPGFYQVHQATPSDVEITLAANLDAREASPERLDVERFVEDIRASAEPPRADAAPTRRQAAGYEREQQLWYAILATALALMLIEALCANWIGIRRSLRGVQAG